MVYKRKSQVIMSLCILAAILVFPVHLFAQEAAETVEHEAGFYYTVQKGTHSGIYQLNFLITHGCGQIYGARTARSPIHTGFIRVSVFDFFM